VLDDVTDTYSRVSDTAQSMWKKSTARIVAACARRKVRQRSSRAAGGGIRCERRILRMVPAPIRCPRRRSSPWTRTTPQRGLSRASLTISSASSPASGGRPGALGWVHFLGDHAPVPAQQCSRGDDPVRPQRLGQEPGQRGEQRPVRPSDPRLGAAAAQHRHLVTQDQDLGVLRRRGPGRQRKP
jgi:hypothetical protein